METIKVKITGIAPLINNNSRKVNPLDPLVKKLKAITSKRKKSDDDHAQIARIEWEAGHYYDSKLGPVVPGQNIDAMLRSGARISKRGKDVERGMMTVEDQSPIEYDGPRDLDKLYSYKGGAFVDTRPMGHQKVKVMRTRPIFHDWALTFSVAYDPGIFNRDDVIAILNEAGRLCGLNDSRPRYGRFSVEVLN